MKEQIELPNCMVVDRNKKWVGFMVIDKEKQYTELHTFYQKTVNSTHLIRKLKESKVKYKIQGCFSNRIHTDYMLTFLIIKNKYLEEFFKVIQELNKDLLIKDKDYDVISKSLIKYVLEKEKESKLKEGDKL